MSTGPTRSSNLPRRTGQLSLLTLALLASGACSLPALAAEPAQASSPRMGDYRFSIGQQPLVSAINAFSQVTGWQVGFSAELADGVASPGRPPQPSTRATFTDWLTNAISRYAVRNETSAASRPTQMRAISDARAMPVASTRCQSPSR